MAAISSLGVGSGLDLGSLVESLLAAERAPLENSLNRREAQITSDLSGVGLMKSALATFKASLDGLDNTDSYKSRSASNSNPSALGVALDNDAQLGSYSININTLAASQSLASKAYSGIGDIVGSGTIQIRFGTVSGPGFGGFTPNPDKSTQTITVDNSNNTLQGLKETINNGDYGVTASIVNDGSGYRLTLASDDTGAANAMEITITDSGDGNDTDSNGLSALAYNASATNLSETLAGVDAAISVNGLAITSASNTLSEVIDGASLTLSETTTSPLTLSISENFSQISNSIRDVVDAYNVLIGDLSDLSFAPADGAQGGLLVGDASLRNLTSNLRRTLTSNVEGLAGSITALSTIGITTQLDGNLAIDETRFGNAIKDNPSGALALFAPLGRTSDPLIRFNASGANTQVGNYAVNITSVQSSGYIAGPDDVTSLRIRNNNNNLTLTVDGVSTGNVQFANGNYADENAIAAEMQTKINASSALVANNLSVTVTYNAATDQFVITSDSSGSSSAVEITAIDPRTNQDWGFVVGAGVSGTDLAGTIGGETATVSGQTLTIGNGLSVDVLGGAVGPRGNIEFSRGIIEDLESLLDSYLDSSQGNLSSREKGLNEALEDITDERAALNLRLQAVEARLVAQFSALDLLVARFQNTSSFITQQIGNLPGSGNLVGNS